MLRQRQCFGADSLAKVRLRNVIQGLVGFWGFDAGLVHNGSTAHEFGFLGFATSKCLHQ